MTFEFIILDLRTKEDVFKVVRVPEYRFEGVKASYENALKKVQEDARMRCTVHDYVLLINRCDDKGNFEEIVQ